MEQGEYKEYFKEFNWPWYMPEVKDYYKVISSVGGYVDIEIYEENADRYFNNEEELIGWIDQPSIVPFLQQLPEKLKARFIEEVVTEMVKFTKEPDGRCFEEFSLITVFLLIPSSLLIYLIL